MTQVQRQDSSLLERFQNDVGSRILHFEDAPEGPALVNPSPLIDLTAPLKECARREYNIDLSDKQLTVLGKRESKIAGGSVKARSAVEIVRYTIAKGKLGRGQTVFEATSGKSKVVSLARANSEAHVKVVVNCHFPHCGIHSPDIPSMPARGQHGRMSCMLSAFDR